METYSIARLSLDVQVREDGRLVARGKELPIMIVANDLPALRRKMSDIAKSVEQFLGELGEPAASCYLKERGVVTAGVGQADDLSMPVLVGA